MDYIALNHQNFNPGVHYNAGGKIGGVKYYTPTKKTVIVENDSESSKGVIQKKIIVEIEEKTLTPLELEEKLFSDAEEKSEIISAQPYEAPQNIEIISTSLPEYNLGEQEKRELKTNQTLEAIDQNNNNELLKRLEELVETLNTSLVVTEKPKINSEYVINIQGKEVNFSNYGIKKSQLTIDDRRWLAKAQNYFITAKEDGVRIGSAEDFTTMEILEALWSTANHVGTDPKRFIVQIYNESRFNPNARGQAGERGIGQFMEATANAYNYNWTAMNDGIEGFAYQALASADFVKKVGEIAYNGSGEQALKYQKKIENRLEAISDADTECVMSNIAKCSS